MGYGLGLELGVRVSISIRGRARCDYSPKQSWQRDVTQQVDCTHYQVDIVDVRQQDIASLSTIKTKDNITSLSLSLSPNRDAHVVYWRLCFCREDK
jgi:hypothetical protein